MQCLPACRVHSVAARRPPLPEAGCALPCFCSRSKRAEHMEHPVAPAASPHVQPRTLQACRQAAAPLPRWAEAGDARRRARRGASRACRPGCGRRRACPGGPRRCAQRSRGPRRPGAPSPAAWPTPAPPRAASPAPRRAAVQTGCPLESNQKGHIAIYHRGLPLPTLLMPSLTSSSGAEPANQRRGTEGAARRPC